MGPADFSHTRFHLLKSRVTDVGRSPPRSSSLIFRCLRPTAHSCCMESLLRSVADFAEQHDGVVTTHQARALGASSLLIHRWVERGLVNRIGVRSLSFPGHPQSWRLWLRTALNEAGDGALISHRAAARLHGFDGFTEGPIEVIAARRFRNRTITGVVHSVPTVPLIDRCMIAGFPCTTPARTIIDLAGCCLRYELENAVDSAIRDGGTSLAFLHQRLSVLRTSGRAGVALLDSVLVDAGGANRLEREFLRLCRLDGLPRPQCQVVHRRGTQTVARVDFDFWPPALVVEVEGQSAHASPRQRQRDAKRRRDLTALGRVVYCFTFEDVFQGPQAVMRDVRVAMARHDQSRQIS